MLNPASRTPPPPLTFITGNPNKAREVERILGYAIQQESFPLEEIQAIDLETVVSHKVQQAYLRLRRPVLVEDTGLAFAAWNGLPGALIKWFLQALGPEGICKLLRDETNRTATAMTVFAYADGTLTRLFPGVVVGEISPTPRGTNGFGWDAIFQPLGSNQTFAEMIAAEKDRFSMRRLALERLRDSGLLNPSEKG